MVVGIFYEHRFRFFIYAAWVEITDLEKKNTTPNDWLSTCVLTLNIQYEYLQLATRMGDYEPFCSVKIDFLRLVFTQNISSVTAKRQTNKK